MKTRIYSRMFEENASVDDDGTVRFEKGAVYTSGEIEVLKKCAPADRKGIHKVKTIFDGDLEFLGECIENPIEFPQKLITLKDENGHEKRMSAVHSFNVSVGETLTFSDGVNMEKYQVTEVEIENNAVSAKTGKKEKKENDSQPEQLSLF